MMSNDACSYIADDQTQADSVLSWASFFHHSIHLHIFSPPYFKTVFIAMINGVHCYMVHNENGML